MSLRLFVLFALVAMVAFVGCGPKEATDTPEEPPAAEQTEPAAEGSAPAEAEAEAEAEGSAAAEPAVEVAEAAEEETLGDLEDEFGEFEVVGGGSASAAR